MERGKLIKKNIPGIVSISSNVTQTNVATKNLFVSETQLQLWRCLFKAKEINVCLPHDTNYCNLIYEIIW